MPPLRLQACAYSHFRKSPPAGTTAQTAAADGAIPCPEQDACWREPERRAYRTLLEQADEQVLICPHYTPYCMHARNRWMVEHSARVIAVFGGSPGGTANTIQLAQKKRREIVRIDPLNPFAFSL